MPLLAISFDILLGIMNATLLYENLIHGNYGFAVINNISLIVCIACTLFLIFDNI